MREKITIEHDAFLLVSASTVIQNEDDARRFFGVPADAPVERKGGTFYVSAPPVLGCKCPTCKNKYHQYA